MQAKIASTRLLLLVAPVCLPVVPIYAECSNPNGKEKDIIYNNEYHTYEFCDETQWYSMEKTIPARGRAGGGYFVMTKAVYNGDLGSAGDDLRAPDAKCLTELTGATGWKGYTTARGDGQLIAGKVHPFLCTERVCSPLKPLTTYYFANSADFTAGGASFTTDANGDGPNDSADWSTPKYFNGAYVYWTGYRNPRTDSSWSDTPIGGGYQCKTTNGWDTENNSAKGVYGRSTSTYKERWCAGNDTCDRSHYLICYVDP
jgi:hypothetical protein